MRLVAVLVLALALVAIGGHDASDHHPPGRGFVLLGWHNDTYLEPRSDAALRRMAADGSNNVAIFSQWFLASPTASVVTPDPTRTPTDGSILHAMAAARAAGMRVTLKPQLSIHSGGWIGTAHPADLRTFWRSYSAMMLHYADLAERAGASTLVVGTEMKTLTNDAGPWRALIAAVRGHFHGALTYAADYDEFQRVPFWDALDYIGIDAYFALADDANPAPGSRGLARAWSERGYVAAIAALSRETHKKVLFTELGYRAIRETAAHPNRWQTPGATDTSAQADAYRAFYAAVANQPWLAGVYWWAVNPDPTPPQDYSPIGKPAESVLAHENLRAMLRWWPPDS